LGGVRAALHERRHHGDGAYEGRERGSGKAVFGDADSVAVRTFRARSPWYARPEVERPQSGERCAGERTSGMADAIAIGDHLELPRRHRGLRAPLGSQEAEVRLARLFDAVNVYAAGLISLQPQYASMAGMGLLDKNLD